MHNRFCELFLINGRNCYTFVLVEVASQVLHVTDLNLLDSLLFAATWPYNFFSLLSNFLKQFFFSCMHRLAVPANLGIGCVNTLLDWAFAISSPSLIFSPPFLLWPLEGFSSTAVAFEGEPCVDPHVQ